MENKMETTTMGLYWGYIMGENRVNTGMMENKMEATMMG